MQWLNFKQVLWPRERIRGQASDLPAPRIRKKMIYKIADPLYY
jgi:hypothetical protein